MSKPSIKQRVMVGIEPSDSAQEEVELDYRILLTGDYSKSGAGEHKDGDGTLKQRRVRTIAKKGDVKKVMNELNPSIEFSVPNRLSKKKEGEDESDGTEFEIKLDFKEMKDFHPDRIAQKVLPIRKLIEERERLKAIKKKVVNDAKFKKNLEKNLSTNKDDFISTLMSQLETTEDSDDTNNDQKDEG